jgi:hypothetical protein
MNSMSTKGKEGTSTDGEKLERKMRERKMMSKCFRLIDAAAKYFPFGHLPFSQTTPSNAETTQRPTPAQSRRAILSLG